MLYANKYESCTVKMLCESAKSIHPSHIAQSPEPDIETFLSLKFLHVKGPFYTMIQTVTSIFSFVRNVFNPIKDKFTVWINIQLSCFRFGKR